MEHYGYGYDERHARSGLMEGGGVGDFSCGTSARFREGNMDDYVGSAGYSAGAGRYDVQQHHVAQRLEQLDSVIGVVQDGGLDQQFMADALNHNPGGLAGWIESMIEELDPAQQHHPSYLAEQFQESPTETQSTSYWSSTESSLDSGGSDSRNFVMTASFPDMYVDNQYEPEFGTGLYPIQSPPVEFAEEKQVSEGDGEESGVRLVHLILACAEAVQRNDQSTAEETIRRIQVLTGSSPQKGPLEKVAAHFVRALARRIFGITAAETASHSLSELLDFHYYETLPFLKFGHFTANQAILEAVQSQKRVHVIDFNLMHGLQWPALIQALALRPGGPPLLRLTGIGPPQAGGNDVLQEIGVKLAQIAESVNVPFDFRGIAAHKLDDVKPWMLQVRHGEVVCVNAVNQMHRLLHGDGYVPPINEVLHSIRSLEPCIVTMVEHEANHNSASFLDRFMEALHYYSTMFDSLESCNVPGQKAGEHTLVEMYLGREICNIVACEGAERVERHETLAQWSERLVEAGFQPRHLGSNAFKQASMLLQLFPGDGYQVQEDSGCLTLGWQNRPLVSASAWHVAH